MTCYISASNFHRASLEKTRTLLQHFIKAVSETTSAFQEKKVGNGPSVAHAVGVAEFKSANASIEKDLNSLLGSGPLSGDDAVYSVHFSDLNGLSKLENNIIAHEISVYLCKLISNLSLTVLRHSSKQGPTVIHHSINNNQ
jgi:dihydroxyacetone kinase